ncbi:MAG: hypothetical protein JW768_06605 [Chitinispirillaceae bacterium]|nr:hypothetical protein [Chitinispirillaceae bacterium]
MKVQVLLFRVLSCAALVALHGCDKDPVSTQSSEKAITAFSMVNPAVTGTIDESAKTISLLVPEGTNVRSLTAVFTTTGVSVGIGSEPQISGMTVNDFSSPVQYIVTAEDNSTATYTVTVTVAYKRITQYSFPSIPATGSIDESKKTIKVAVPGGTDVTALVAEFATTGVGVSVGTTVQESGVTANDFTGTVVYTVKGADNTTADYAVSVVQSVPADWTTHDWTTAVEPPAGWLDRESMNTYCTVSDGILSFNSNDPSLQAHYRYQFASPLPVGSKMTLAFKARADGGAGTLAWMLDFQNSYRAQLEIRNGQISLQNGTSTISSATVSEGAWHTYFVSYEITESGLAVNVHVDGAPTATVAGTATASTTSIFIRLGDMSNNNAYQGSLDWIIWTTDGAFFPGGVDLPQGFSLVP